MKVRVPEWQFAAAARETPRARKGGNDYSDYVITLYDLFIFILNVVKVGNS